MRLNELIMRTRLNGGRIRQNHYTSKRDYSLSYCDCTDCASDNCDCYGGDCSDCYCTDCNEGDDRDC